MNKKILILAGLLGILLMPDVLLAVSPLDGFSGGIRSILSNNLLVAIVTIALLVLLIGAIFSDRIEWKHFFIGVFIAFAIFGIDKIVLWIKTLAQAT